MWWCKVMNCHLVTFPTATVLIPMAFYVSVGLGPASCVRVLTITPSEEARRPRSLTQLQAAPAAPGSAARVSVRRRLRFSFLAHFPTNRKLIV